VEAGQVFYFNVHPQGDGAAERAANLTPTDLAATQAKPRQTTLSATVANRGDADASDVVVRFRDGDTVIASSTPVDVPAGSDVTVTVGWDTARVKGDHRVTAVVDPDDTVPESDESDNELTRTISVRGNKVTNGSFEESSSGSAPAAWSGSGGTTYDTSGAYASDGTAAVGLTGGLLGASWTSAPVSVSPGERYDLSLSFAGVAPTVAVSFLDRAGGVVSTLPLQLSAGGGALTGGLRVPTGATALRVGVAAAPTLGTGRTTWVDDVWLW
jgi:hypothetical protein